MIIIVVQTYKYVVHVNVSYNKWMPEQAWASKYYFIST